MKWTKEYLIDWCRPFNLCMRDSRSVLKPLHYGCNCNCSGLLGRKRQNKILTKMLPATDLRAFFRIIVPLLFTEIF